MTVTERPIQKEKPFEGLKVYYSGSIKGVANPEPDFAFNLVNYILELGADVLSEHVGGRNSEEMNEIFLHRTGIDRRTIQNPWYLAREVDMKWVDEATHLIAVVNGPSHGVGMELERAILKPQRGLKQTPILCLVQEGLMEKLTWMVRGISKEECPNFYLETYKELADAKTKIIDFLTRTM
jgi:hypothetical protein